MSQVNLKKTLDIVEAINEYIARKEKELPYNINVIDELHANENAHSRILCKLLQYKDSSNKFRILEDLIQYISQLDGREEFANIEIVSPNITQEQERIDLRVLESGKYAIIFENKVKGAGDQPNQLARYIKKTIDQNVSIETIYVIYLTADGHEPTDDSWVYVDESGNQVNYKKVFEERYVNLSYKTHILPWLAESILPNCIIKEELLISAIKQYIDHLEGMFWMRPSQKEMIMEHELLNLLKITDKDVEQQVKYVVGLSKDISNIQNILDKFKDEKLREITDENISFHFVPQLRELAERLKGKGLCCRINKVDLENIKGAEIDWTKQYTKITFKREEWGAFEIGFNFEGKNLTQLISGIRHIDSLDSKPDVHKKLVEIFTNHKHSGWWPAYQFIPEYNNLLTLEMQEHIKNGELIKWMEDKVNYYFSKIENLNL